MLTELAEDCAAAGFDVEVVTGRGTYRRSDRAPLPAREVHAGVRIRRLPSLDFGRATLLGRALDYLSFAVAALVSLLSRRPTDVLVVVSSPPLLPAVGALARRLRGGRLVYKVEDLYPDLAVALGLLRRGPVARLAAASARFVARASDAVVAIDAHMVEPLRRAGLRGPVEVIGNWADPAEYRGSPAQASALRAELGLDDCFVVLYSGNFGLAHTFEGVLAAAAARPDIVFLFVGDGPQRPRLARAAAQLPNLRLLPFQPRARLAATHALADVVLVTLRPEADGLVMPSKLYAALAAGRPVLFVGGDANDAARLVREHALGWAVPDEADAIAVALDEARARPLARRDADAARIRAVFEAHFQRGRMTDAWVALLARVAGKAPVSAIASAAPVHALRREVPA